MTLKLCGFAASNYFNKVKLQLLEKGVPYEEELVWTGNTHPLLIDRSPMGKVPFLDTPSGPISESSACAEYIEAAYPQRPLLPADPLAAAKVRELIVYMELHLELVARELYPEAFFGGQVSDGLKERTRKLLFKGVSGFSKLAKFSPFVAGSEFTLADCAAYNHLPLAALATRAVYGSDLVAAAGIDWKAYVRLIEQRPSAQRVAADRKANTLPLKSV